MTERIKNLLEKNNFTEVKSILSAQKPADVANLIEMLPKELQTITFRILPKNHAAEVFAYFDSQTQHSLIKTFSDSELKEVLSKLFADDTVDMIEEMPSNVVKRILKHSDKEMRKSINMLLQYPKDSAGSIMTTEYVSLKEEMTVKEAFERIKRVGVDKETIYTLYITEKNRKLVGIVSAKNLMLSDDKEIISNIMDRNFKYVTTEVDRETVADIFGLYDLLALPVVDFEGRLVGIVTVDDAIDVINKEWAEDIEAIAAIVPGDKPYIKTGVFETFLKRIPWLFILMISASLTGAIIRKYEISLQGGYVILTAFIPMLMGTGGNCGSQASVSVIRSLSLNEIGIKDIFKVAFKEFRVAFLCAIALSVVNFFKLIIFDKVSNMIALTVCLALSLTVFIAKLIGCSLPLLVKFINLDPAVMASPFITTIVDTLSLVVYFNIASLLLNI